MENIFFSILVGFALGTLFYYYDRKSGKNLYRKWYNLSNKEKLDEKETIGFVDGRLFGQKLKISIVIAIIFYVLCFIMAGIAFKGLFYAGGVLIGSLASFYISGKLLSLFSKKASKTIEYIESIEKGEKNLKEELKGILPKKDEKGVKEEPAKTESTNVDSQESKISEEPKKEENKDNWRDGINKFLDK